MWLDGRLLGSWPETGFREVRQIGADKSARVDRYGHWRQARLSVLIRRIKLQIALDEC
jgi:hypothetical protein